MNNYQEYSQLLTALLKCGYADLQKLVDLYQDGVGIGAFENWEVVVAEAEALEFNSMMYAVMKLTNNKVFSDVITAIEDRQLDSRKEKYLINKAEDRLQYFYPYLNYLDFSFNNELDETLDCEDILNEWLKELDNE